MNRNLTACGIALVCFGASSAHAFFEEGNDDLARLGYLKCSKAGDLSRAEATGCNPWQDNDSSYTFQKSKDMKKSSLHYNATQALAVAAGFDRCAAFIVGLADEATDVATSYDLDLWIPFPKGVDPNNANCKVWLADSGISVKTAASGQVGGFYSPDFTFRSFGTTQGNEVNRESATFHWNHTDIDGTGKHGCSPVNDPAPSVSPDGVILDFLSLYELRQWAESPGDPVRWSDPLNSCSYANGSVLGPIGNYDPNADAAPGTLAALGSFLHSAQDRFSHQMCSGINHDFTPGTDTDCGFVSGHYAGEFGAINGKPANGAILVKTSASTKGYKVNLHSLNTAEGVKKTYWLLVEYLNLFPEYRVAQGCDTRGFNLQGFADAFSIIPNVEGQPSGAKKRSDLADSLFNSSSCTYTVPKLN